MRRTRVVSSAGLSVVAAVVLLTACGGGTGTSVSAASDSPTVSSSPASSAAPRAGTPFCLDMANEVPGPDPSTMRSDPPKFAAFLKQVTAQYRLIQPPAELATDWKAVTDGLDQFATAYATVDPHDPASLRAFAQRNATLLTSLKAAARRVQAYLTTYCGLNTSAVSSI